MFKKARPLPQFVAFFSLLNVLLFHFSFFYFVVNQLDMRSAGSILLVISLVALSLILYFFIFFILTTVSVVLGKILMALTFIGSAISVYFIQAYGVIMDESMMGNVLNTNYEESRSFLSVKLILYVLLLGVLPAVVLYKTRVIRVGFKKSILYAAGSLVLIVALSLINSKNWLWVDKHSKSLGGLAMPWSYLVNTSLHYVHTNDRNKKAITLPDATIADTTKTVMVLVIGESARSQNFSLYGYPKNTNPLLSKTEGVTAFKATSCATYTTAGVKCILEHAPTPQLHEILPNYLYRNGVDVIWRTTNWGEPPVHIKSYLKKEDLMPLCQGENCAYDELLLSGLKEQILASQKNKILVILHTSTSHGPTYSKKYPAQFEVFKPVCNTVELGKCSQNELLNAYDNTIVYTDYLLHSLIEQLKQLPEYKTSLMFVSDHGESLGENNLYMHGVPMSIAPPEQIQIPFIVWKSAGSRELKVAQTLTQNHVFHSVLDFLSIKSPVYNPGLSVFQ